MQTIPNLGLVEALPLGGGGAARFGLDWGQEQTPQIRTIWTVEKAPLSLVS